MNILNTTSFFATLDEGSPVPRIPRFRVAKSILAIKGFSESEYFDVFSVLMAQDGMVAGK